MCETEEEAGDEDQHQESNAVVMKTGTRSLTLRFQPHTGFSLGGYCSSPGWFTGSSKVGAFFLFLSLTTIALVLVRFWFCSGSGSALGQVLVQSVVKDLMRCDLLPFRLQLIDDLSYEDVKKCYRGSVSNTHIPVLLLL